MNSGPTPKDLQYDLTTPCKDCPFRYDVPLHRGVAVDLADLLPRIMNETAAHTCHKTDPRSDCESAKSFKGPPQHCAGFLIMLRKKGYSTIWMDRAVVEGRLDLGKLNLQAPVYSLTGLIRRYTDWMKTWIVGPDGNCHPPEVSKGGAAPN